MNTSCLTSKGAEMEAGADFLPGTAKGTRPVYITNSKKINLLLPEYAERTVDLLQLLNGSFGEESFSLMVYSQIDSQGISLSLFNDFGTDMGSVFFDGKQVVFDSAYFPKSLPGEYILADIQNAFYDEAALRANYSASKLNFEAAAGLRRILDGKKIIEEIEISESQITIKNFLRKYEYQLIFEVLN
ncbi:MAG: DUF3261 domain-containing protein [Treponema sp.]|nr:DUF3261 domain-containing protein [Treponema sp.]